MHIRKALLALVVAGLLAFAVPQTARAQEAKAGGDRNTRGGRGGRFDPAQMRQRMLDYMKQNLKAGDEEWAVIKPRLEKVMELSRQANSRGRGMGGRRRGGRGGDAQPQQPEREQSAVEKAVSDLQATLEKDNAPAEQIKAQLTALREAREKAKQELAKAQASLRELLTMKQEAQLVMMGLMN